MVDMDESSKIARFWEKYADKSKRYGVRDKSLKWYVRHAEQYIKSHSSRLSEHTAETVDDYLEAKGRNIHLKDWQFIQLVVSLEILFIDVLPLPWSVSYPWDSKKQQSIDLQPSHATIARVPFIEISPAVKTDSLNAQIQSDFADVFNPYICEIRTRNYSIRTEQSYVGWLVRFILFHKNKHPESLGESDIASYLTYLAVNRMVSSSTQRQALNAIIFLYKQIFKRTIEDIGTFTLSKKPARLPVVFV